MAAARRRISTWRELIGLWPDSRSFADDCGQIPNYPQVVRLRGVCTTRHWPGIIAGAKKRGIPGIDAELLLHIDRAEDKSRQTKSDAA